MSPIQNELHETLRRRCCQCGVKTVMHTCRCLDILSCCVCRGCTKLLFCLRHKYLHYTVLCDNKHTSDKTVLLKTQTAPQQTYSQVYPTPSSAKPYQGSSFQNNANNPNSLKPNPFTSPFQFGDKKMLNQKTAYPNSDTEEDNNQTLHSSTGFQKEIIHIRSPLAHFQSSFFLIKKFILQNAFSWEYFLLFIGYALFVICTYHFTCTKRVMVVYFVVKKKAYYLYGREKRNCLCSFKEKNHKSNLNDYFLMEQTVPRHPQ
ncbi:hypothetical protein RFI_00906 [Reticulomyxa filosa]|uniref:Uncharacterized protein n=1 Tax=Reticulomyxa filosa TaxID=46433 RepID=X6PEP4_RETFI|nr:hypothetical protein RFI_00906 [Reticulomyxa filosa]|eukprot:ETO36157.1 hypothetical protein RFI_00906 [Reticulomyxa filosa]